MVRPIFHAYMHTCNSCNIQFILSSGSLNFLLWSLIFSRYFVYDVILCVLFLHDWVLLLVDLSWAHHFPFIADLYGRSSQTKLILTHFYTNTNFYWLFGKIWPSCFRNKSNFWRKKFGEVMTERNNWPLLRAQYMATWQDGTFDGNMTSSSGVYTRHRLRMFLRRSLLLKIKPSTGQTLGTTDKRERRKNMAKSVGGPCWLLRLWRHSLSD